MHARGRRAAPHVRPMQDLAKGLKNRQSVSVLRSRLLCNAMVSLLDAADEVLENAAATAAHAAAAAPAAISLLSQ
jgi:hypothetical protein